MSEAVLTYQCGKQVKEVGLVSNDDIELLNELEDDLSRFIKLQLIDGKSIIIPKDVIISITYRN
ncbi:hypothetical protein [Cellulosilyticum lentocellum]|uniref:Uncharacterized protein n=1 Tax=Cellulosilyticum lentocellum (strain ATCC 49066 / DSM 5427 / NCIMB 11756 / RHM5) TaxID=642492 RepID=F2JK43_CELLD|nr:hypothetical protein [Cellulosilyticum lentocellum]ADZ84458.1 hypothetical protein Clole_2759 [Cellulosilyticum lentocellum DSM 5427]